MATSGMPGDLPNNHFLATHLFSVPNLKAVVTGGGTGIGLMIAQALATNGATVYITSRRTEAIETAAEKHAGTIIPIQADIGSQESLYSLVQQVASKEPNGIHLLVNNAGVAEEQETTAYKNTPDLDFSNAESLAAHLGKATRESWQKTFDTNVTSQFFVSAAFLPLLAKGTQTTVGYSSSIVNVASVSGIMKGSSSGQFAYSASKAAFLQVTRNLANAFKEVKVRVNCIAPGIFPSEMTAGGSDEKNKSSLEGSGREEGLPARRTGSDEDMAAAILYLAGKGGLFLNGQVVHPDGGDLIS